MKTAAEFYEEQAATYCTLYNDVKHEVRMIVLGVESGDINFEEAVEKLKALTALE